MGATKLHLYSQKTIRNSELGKAINAPARIIILSHIQKQHFITGPELEKILKLDKSTIHQHLTVLIETGLIQGLFIDKSYGWRLNPDTANDFEKIKWALNTEF